MSKEISISNWNYAHWTFRTGTKPFWGLEMLLENVQRNFEVITAHGDGSFSDTNDLICRNAFSDTAIIMSYALLEGFFAEEYDFYIKKKRPKSLIDIIEEVAAHHNLKINDWKSRKMKIDMLKKLRNAAVHNNGAMPKQIDVKLYEEAFGENAFKLKRYSVQFSLDGALNLIREFKKIADEYAEAVFMAA